MEAAASSSSATPKSKQRSRAAPRKARKDPSEAPAFIAKTFEMVESAEDDVLGWTEDGTLFVVRDEQKFVEQLPRFFRHRNFRSFVRQLNFYGFRKLRVEEIKTKTPANNCSMFHHQHFRRGRPELLKLIKPKRMDADVDTEVVELRDQVKSMEERIEHMTSEIERLTGLVTAVLAEQQQANASRKRHRDGTPVLSPPPSPEALRDTPSPPPVPSLGLMGSSLRWMDSVGEDLLPDIDALQLADGLERSTSAEVVRHFLFESTPPPCGGEQSPLAEAAAAHTPPPPPSSSLDPGVSCPSSLDPGAACEVKEPPPSAEAVAFGA